MRRRDYFFIAIASAVMIAACLAIPRFVTYVDEIHLRNVTIAIAQWGEEYRDGTNWGGAKHARDMLQYVEGHYRYEDMPEYRDSAAAKKLAEQRRETLTIIQDWLKANP
jgi:hypothetical protein